MNDRLGPGAVAGLGLADAMPPREAALFVRYLRALALLAECAPYVDEPDYAAQIDEVLDDAAVHHALDVVRDGPRRGIAPRGR